MISDDSDNIGTFRLSEIEPALEMAEIWQLVIDQNWNIKAIHGISGRLVSS